MTPKSPAGFRPEEQTQQLQLHAARDGSAKALGCLLQSCRPLLLVLANQELDSDLRAKGGPSDLVQQTFLDALKDFANFAGQTIPDLINWLRVIQQHNVIDFVCRYRKTGQRQLVREQSLEVVPENVLEAAMVEMASPAEQVAQQEERHMAQSAVQRLPENYRRVIQLRHQEDRSFVEIGRLLDRSASAARKLWLRAIGRLRLELGETDEPV